MPNFTLVFHDGTVRAASGVSEAAEKIGVVPVTPVTVYGPRDAFETLRREVIRRGEENDHGAISRCGEWKRQGISSSDREEINDMKESAYERLKNRPNQLRYGGPAHPGGAS